MKMRERFRMAPPRRWERIVVLLALAAVCGLNAWRFAMGATGLSDDAPPFGLSAGGSRVLLTSISLLGLVDGVVGALAVVRGDAGRSTRARGD